VTAHRSLVRGHGSARPYLICVVTLATLVAYVSLGAELAGVRNLASVGESPGPDARFTSVLADFAGLGCLLLGALVASRRRRQPIGWLLFAIGIAWVAIGGSTDLAYTQPSTLLGKVALVVWAPLVALSGWTVALLLASFPSGAVPRGWRQVALALGALAAVVDIVACLLQQKLEPSGSRWFTNPIGDASTHGFVDVATKTAPYGIVVVALVMAIDLVMRWRRSTSTERQQMKFLGYAVLVELPLLVVLVATIPDHNGWAAWFFTALNAFAVAIALAVMRFRLYDIDRLVSRTVAYGIVTGVVVGVYAASIGLTGKVLGLSSPVAVAASTLCVAALFNPLRRRIQHGVDRRFNRVRYDAEATVSTFAARLRESVRLDLVREELVDAVQRSVEPTSIVLWLPPATFDRRPESRSTRTDVERASARADLPFGAHL